MWQVSLVFAKIKPMTQQFNNSIFWIEVEKIKPNPFQPRRDFDENSLQALAESIRQYGILQPLVVTRQEIELPDGGLAVEYELIAGERRLRAAKIANVSRVPAVIRTGDETDKLKLELAIIENLQREDLNPVDRARAFHKLAQEFNYKHHEIATKVGKSREYVSNSIRILALPEEALNAVRAGEITEGHTRPLLMLLEKPEEMVNLLRDMIRNRMKVREAEQIAQRIAPDRVRKREILPTPEVLEYEEKLSERLGTRVRIETRNPEVGAGKITIDYFSAEELRALLDKLSQESGVSEVVDGEIVVESPKVSDENSLPSKDSDDSGLYSVTNFTV